MVGVFLCMNKKVKTALISIGSNTFLVLIKLIVGFITGSISIISEAMHSAIDLLAALMAYFAVKKASFPADDEHRYGHSKIENVAGFVEAILIFLAGLWIIYEAVYKLINPQDINMIGLAIFVMLFSATVNYLVSKRLLKVARETDSIALEADAMHLRTDIYTSVGVMLALFFIWFLKKIFISYQFYWIDPLVAIIVAILIIKTSWDLTKKSFGDLIDTSLPEDEISLIEEIISSNNGVKSFKKLKTRKAGNEKFIEVDLLFDENISLKDAHNLTDEVTIKIKEKFRNANITIHMEPCSSNCNDDNCSNNCNR